MIKQALFCSSTVQGGEKRRAGIAVESITLLLH
jgi:hypothetical protein